MSQLYLTSSKFKSFLPDWIITFFLIFVFFYVTERWEPFHRQFYINDAKLMHPFATQERVTDNQLYILSTLIPMIVISILSLYLAPTNFDKLHLLQVSNLGLLFGVSAVSVLTDILKCWIGNPRPDFIDRCGPKEGTPLNVLFSISDQICTSPYGAKYLSDGMKSTPSGHSSMAFAGLVYLSLWLIGQFKLINRQNELDNKLVFLIIVCLPILLASYIGLSRTQDYRHHFFDVCFGSGLGIVFAVVSYFKYFRTLSDSKCNEPIDY